MTSVLAVYVGESMKANLEVAIERGVWGCPVPQQMQLRAGDFVMFGGGVPGGPRQTGNRPTAADGSELDVDRSWFSRSAGFIVLGRVTSTCFGSRGSAVQIRPSRRRSTEGGNRHERPGGRPDRPGHRPVRPRPTRSPPRTERDRPPVAVPGADLGSTPGVAASAGMRQRPVDAPARSEGPYRRESP